MYPRHYYHIIFAPLLLLCTASVAVARGNISHSSTDSRPLRCIIVPITGNSPAMDLMGVAAQLEERGHDVLVPGALDFMKTAAARHSSNTTAEAFEYISVDMGIAAANQQQQQRDETQDHKRQQQQQQQRNEGPDHKQQQQQHRVVKGRFAVPNSVTRSMIIGLEMLLDIQDLLAEPCSTFITNTTVFKHLEEFQADAVMGLGLSVFGGFASDSCGCLLSHALDVALIDVDGAGLWTGPITVPQFGTGLVPSDLDTWHGYTLNLLTWAIRQSLPLVSHFWGPNSWQGVRDRVGLPRAKSDCPLVNALQRVRGKRLKKCKALMGVILGSWVLEYPRVLPTNQVMVGPGTPRPPQPISAPADVAEFVNTAHEGLILVAFGTSFQFNRYLTADDYIELAHAFAALGPVRVLWNLNSQGLPEHLQLGKLAVADNIRIVPWVDYDDILGHPNKRLMVSHCGLHSIYEAIYHGVPVLGVPFIFEQVETCNQLAIRGAAVLSQQSPAYRTSSNINVHYTRQQIKELVKTVLQDTSYAKAAKAMSTALQTYAKRRHPYERAADEVEVAVLTLHAKQQLAGQKQRNWSEQRRSQTDEL